MSVNFEWNSFCLFIIENSYKHKQYLDMKTVNKNNLWLPAIFDNFFLENRLDASNNYETFSIPAVNIIEKSSNFALEIAAPGLGKEDFKIEVEEDMLKVSAQKATQTETEENNDSQFRKREFNYESFTRSFRLPDTIETDKIQAKYKNGILSVTLPKMEEMKVLKKMVEIS